MGAFGLKVADAMLKAIAGVIIAQAASKLVETVGEYVEVQVTFKKKFGKAKAEPVLPEVATEG